MTPTQTLRGLATPNFSAADLAAVRKWYVEQYGETGLVAASVIDPFGNILGIMYHLHYLDIPRQARTTNRIIFVHAKKFRQ